MPRLSSTMTVLWIYSVLTRELRNDIMRHAISAYFQVRTCYSCRRGETTSLNCGRQRVYSSSQIYEYGAQVEWYWQEEIEELGGKNLSHCQLVHHKVRSRTQAFAVRNRRLTAWDMAGSFRYLLWCCVSFVYELINDTISAAVVNSVEWNEKILRMVYGNCLEGGGHGEACWHERLTDHKNVSAVSNGYFSFAGIAILFS
jgi:hypothetical protein